MQTLHQHSTQQTDLCRQLARSRGPRPAAQALSDAHTYLFDERERLLALQAENDQLRLQEAEDRSRIKQLLGLTRPVEQALVYPQQQENAALRSNTVFPRQPSHPHPQHPPQRGRSRSPGRGGGGNGGGEGGCGRAAGGERILRTLYLPAAQTEPLALKCKALEAQLAEQRRFNAERIAALAEDRQLRERDIEAQMAVRCRALSCWGPPGWRAEAVTSRGWSGTTRLRGVDSKAHLDAGQLLQVPRSCLRRAGRVPDDFRFGAAAPGGGRGPAPHHQGLHPRYAHAVPAWYFCSSPWGQRRCSDL